MTDIDRCKMSLYQMLWNEERERKCDADNLFRDVIHHRGKSDKEQTDLFVAWMRAEERVLAVKELTWKVFDILRNF